MDGSHGRERAGGRAIARKRSIRRDGSSKSARGDCKAQSETEAIGDAFVAWYHHKNHSRRSEVSAEETTSAVMAGTTIYS